MKRYIIAFLLIILATGMGRSQTELRELSPKAYKAVDTIFSDTATRAYRFLKITNLDNALSIYDSKRHWLSPQFREFKGDCAVHFLCDNTTTSLFLIPQICQGKNWLVTLSGDKIAFPCYAGLGVLSNGMLMANYGADRFFSTPSSYGSLYGKAKALFEMHDSVETWCKVDTINMLENEIYLDDIENTEQDSALKQVIASSTFAIAVPNVDTPLGNSIRSWVVNELGAVCNIEQEPADQDVIQNAMIDELFEYFHDLLTLSAEAVATDLMSHVTIFQRAQTAKHVTFLSECACTNTHLSNGTFRYATFDKLTGKRLTTNDIFKADAHDAINKLIQESISRQMNEKGKNNYEALTYTPHATVASQQEQVLCATDVALLPKGVVFCYQPQELPGFSETSCFVLLPYSKIEQYLKIASPSFTKQ